MENVRAKAFEGEAKFGCSGQFQLTVGTSEKWEQLKVTRKRQPLAETLGTIGGESCNGVGSRGIRISFPAARLWGSEGWSCNLGQSLRDMAVHKEKWSYITCREMGAT